MEAQESERQAKRAFLRQEVIEQGYEPDQFTEFIEREKGADVDEWTMQELQVCVERFKLSLSPQREDEEYQTGLGRTMQEDLSIEEIKTTSDVSRPSQSPAVPIAPDSQLNQASDSQPSEPTIPQELRTPFPPPEMLTCSEISSLMLTEPAYSLPSSPLSPTELSTAAKVTISLGK